MVVDLDDESVELSVASLPPAATLRAIESQNTEELRTVARRYAQSRAQFVRAAGCPIPKNYGQELVDDAIADTWLGVANWDPDRCSLLVHVRGEIRDRTSKDLRRGRRFPRIAMDIAANDPRDAKLIENYLAQSGNDGSPIAFAALVFRIATALKVLACGDENAVALLVCWQESIIERDEILACTNLTRAEYKAARKRLMSLSKKLPPDMRDSAREFLRRAS